MDSIIEEKGTTWKIFLYKIIIGILIINFFRVYGEVYTESSALKYIILIFWGLPIIFVLVFCFFTSVQRIVITNDLLTVDRIFFSAIIIPLKNISRIDKRQNNTVNRYHFAIIYPSKELILNPYYFRAGGTGFDDVINELQRRINIAKAEVVEN